MSSEGALYLDDCSFNESSASVLVNGRTGVTVVRNAVLGNDNCEFVR